MVIPEIQVIRNNHVFFAEILLAGVCVVVVMIMRGCAVIFPNNVNYTLTISLKMVFSIATTINPRMSRVR